MSSTTPSFKPFSYFKVSLKFNESEAFKFQKISSNLNFLTQSSHFLLTEMELSSLAESTVTDVGTNFPNTVGFTKITSLPFDAFPKLRGGSCEELEFNCNGDG